uniref:Uncharacterized protein LOC111101125 isoform X2 n=1 Tax=Crassostrea virginica TaxID=6565 RepID=A0A8B8ACE4_CRAVI|nr:uncharacterized protein LOC111101125 isoform X2 [Crassostrea virginica]
MTENCTRKNVSDTTPNAVEESHTIRENLRPRMQISCKPCFQDTIKAEATKCCKTCKDPEPFCDDCAQRHIRKETNKGHEITDDLRKFFDLSSGENLRPRMQISCKPCFQDTIKAEATKCCKTCKDPEPFCDDCAQRHICKETNKGHEITDDLREFFDLSSGENLRPRMQISCKPCFQDTIKAEATKCCKTCKDPEPFCDDCAQRHIRKETNKGHEITDDLRKFFDLSSGENLRPCMQISCKPCFQDTIKAEATKCCKTCKDPEPFCDDCAQRHIRKETNKGHEITDDLRKFFDLSSGCENIVTFDDKVPGKPFSIETTSKSLTIGWDKPQEKFDCFQVRFKQKDGESKWKSVETDDDSNCITIKEIMADTGYVFQVRGKIDDLEGPYGPISDDITTLESPSAGMLKNCKCICEKTPKTYHIALKENKNARNTEARTKQLILGKPCQHNDERTIMLVGATGSGKSTLVDGIINYILGVNFEDPFRFTLVVLEEEEKKTTDQAQSQTEWITVYKIYPTKGSLINFTLNIIDTPGFGDTRGIERDSTIVEQIRHLFSAKGEQGVIDIDAVCFIAKAPDARLTPTQKYIFGSIMSLFGKDIASNICTLITFADGAEPAVLASLKNSNLPFGKTFTFNNSALFAENRKGIGNPLSLMFWEMGCSSFERFFENIWKFETKSLSLTKNVLNERYQLKTIISNILPQVSEGLVEISNIRKEQEIVKKKKNELNENKDFVYSKDEVKQIQVDLQKGVYVTNCLICNVSCHHPCGISDDDEKGRCAAINQNNGKCEVCPGNCDWREHKNSSYYMSYVTVKVERTSLEMKKRYEEAAQKKLSAEQIIERMKNAVISKLKELKLMMDKVNKCRSSLQKIALADDPLTSEEYINLMIEAEKREHKSGYGDRIKTLEELKKMSQIDKEYERLNDEAGNEALKRLLEDET